MKPDITDLIFLISTILAAIGLSVIIYSRDKGNYSSKLFLFTLLLVVGYIISHGIHFLVMTSGDVTILDRSCHSFLLLINITMAFFAWNFPRDRKTGLVKASIILIPSIIVLALLWGGYLVKESHAHHMHFSPHFTSLYPIYLIWYIFLLVFSSVILIRRYRKESSKQIRMQIITFLVGLVITNLTSFIFGMFIPWIIGFYYLVEASPLAFLVGVIMFTAVAVGKFDMFPKALDRVRDFSINRKVMLIALILVPIIIMLIQVPLGRAVMGISNEDWLNYFAVNVLGGLIVSISMAILINLIISYPLKELKNNALEIKQGNYNTKVSINSNDELGEVADAFNEMAQTLNQNSMELRQKEQRITLLLSAFEKSQASIAVVDKNAKILEANKTFFRLLGLAPSEVLSKSIIDLQFKNRESNELNGILSALKNRANYECEIEYREPSGAKKNLLVTISPVFFDETDYVGHMFVEVDLTERKILENKLLQAEKLAVLGKMSAILAHEIKTPLTSIKMNADILSESLNLSEEDEDSFQIIQKEIKRLNNLVKEVLQFSRQSELNCTKLNVRELIEDVKKQFQIRLDERSTKLIDDVQSLEIVADEEKLRQVFINLIENSLDAISMNGEISISSRLIDKDLQISIKDSGSGIAFPEKVFDPFMTTKASGTGLGLSISQKIIEQHGGMIRLINAKQGETTFEILLPMGA
ncbi:MAG: ATP-binding protein [Bacteroidota bacterium]|nr:ATP-binding protein [Bacteroidota bacterium]